MCSNGLEYKTEQKRAPAGTRFLFCKAGFYLVIKIIIPARNLTQGACPIKVLDYMASAQPLVASNMPIVGELVREDVDALRFHRIPIDRNQRDSEKSD